MYVLQHSFTAYYPLLPALLSRNSPFAQHFALAHLVLCASPTLPFGRFWFSCVPVKREPLALRKCKRTSLDVLSTLQRY